jgi:hypothetical protein
MVSRTTSACAGATLRFEVAPKRARDEHHRPERSGGLVINANEGTEELALPVGEKRNRLGRTWSLLCGRGAVSLGTGSS